MHDRQAIQAAHLAAIAAAGPGSLGLTGVPMPEPGEPSRLGRALAGAARWCWRKLSGLARALWDALPGPRPVKALLVVLIVAVCVAIPGPGDEIAVLALAARAAARKARSS